MVWCILAGILFVAIGAFLFLKPEVYWKLTERWKSYYADEPSDLYIKSVKFGGILFMIFGVVVVVLFFILE